MADFCNYIFLLETNCFPFKKLKYLLEGSEFTGCDQDVPIQDRPPLVGSFRDEEVNQDIVDFAVEELQQEKDQLEHCKGGVKVYSFKSQV